MSRPIWMPGDGSNSIESSAQNQDFRYDRINQLLIGMGITNASQFSALGQYLGYGGGGGCTYQDMQVAWTPSNLKLGEMVGFFSYGDLPGIASIIFDATTTIAGYDIEGGSSITSISWPNLTAIDPTNIQSGYLNIQGLGNLASLDIPKLVSMPGWLQAKNCPNLVTLNIPLFVPTPGTSGIFSGTALDETSVNLVLSRFVASPTWGNAGETLSLGAGTQAPPSGQGIIDVATLSGRGANVTTN